jgi:hypothetical protein
VKGTAFIRAVFPGSSAVLSGSYQGMPSGMPQPRDPQVRLQPLVAHGQGQRLKPLPSRAMDGIAEATP